MLSALPRRRGSQQLAGRSRVPSTAFVKPRARWPARPACLDHHSAAQTAHARPGAASAVLGVGSTTVEIGWRAGCGAKCRLARTARSAERSSRALCCFGLGRAVQDALAAMAFLGEGECACMRVSAVSPAPRIGAADLRKASFAEQAARGAGQAGAPGPSGASAVLAVRRAPGRPSCAQLGQCRRPRR